MAKRINRAIELLEQDQPIYYTGPHTGHVLTYDQGKVDAKTWADYINVGMEHGAFNMAGLFGDSSMADQLIVVTGLHQLLLRHLSKELQRPSFVLMHGNFVKFSHVVHME
jgi:hypothetical protein